MTTLEQQQEELEVLRSIFDGDSAFSIVTDNSIQYRFGDDGSLKSFLLEIRWPMTYPDESGPEFILDLFFNKHLTTETKRTILRVLNEESENLRGSPMTYSLLELVKDRLEELMIHQTTQQLDTDSSINRRSSVSDSDNEAPSGRKQEKEEKLGKAQKRKMWDRGGTNKERERGWNWVDVIKHLSQTGPG